MLPGLHHCHPPDHDGQDFRHPAPADVPRGHGDPDRRRCRPRHDEAAADAACDAAVSRLHQVVKLLLYGARGSGKGTQANMLRGRYGIPHIATGDMLRAEIQAGTELGRKAQPIMAAGGYVPDGVMIEMIRNRLRKPDCAKGFIIDGFPRTVPQAEALDVLMSELERRLD